MTSWRGGSEMARQFALFLAAVQFLTRVPVPHLKDFQPDWTARSTRWFPLVGALVGLACGGVLFAASEIWSGVLPALLAVAVGVLITGAFHEDGLADSLDGLGGGQTRERRLEIMKDSRIGTFGALGLGLVIAIKISALSGIPAGTAVLALVAAHGGGRGAAVVVMRFLPYAGDLAWAKVKPVGQGISTGETVMATALALLAVVPLLIVAPVAAGASLVAAALAAVVMVLAARRLIGGWVGDTLGATEQVFETVFLLAFSAAIALS